MEFKDPDDLIYLQFYEDYHNLRTDWTSFRSYTWYEYIKDIDIGIEYIEAAKPEDVDNEDEDEEYDYKIVDAKKWLVSRLKYGI